MYLEHTTFKQTSADQGSHMLFIATINLLFFIVIILSVGGKMIWNLDLFNSISLIARRPRVTIIEILHLL